MAISTYGDVKLLAEAKLGEGGCAFDDVQLDYAMQHCLEQVGSTVPPAYYASGFTFDLLNGVSDYAIPAGFIVDAVLTSSGVCLSDCGDIQPCDAPPVATKPRFDKDCNVVVALPSLPKSYALSFGFIHFDIVPVVPVGFPAKYTVKGTRAPSPKFFTKTLVSGNLTKTWLPIDLPIEYHIAFTNCVLGNLLLDTDPNQASNYFGLANDAVRTARQNTGKKRPRAMFSKGRKSCSCDSACFPSVLQFESSLSTFGGGCNC